MQHVHLKKGEVQLSLDARMLSGPGLNLHNFSTKEVLYNQMSYKKKGGGDSRQALPSVSRRMSLICDR